MEGFKGRPPLRPPPSPSSSIWCHNEIQGTGNPIDRALAQTPETQQQVQNVDLLEVSRVEVPDSAHDKKLKRILATREYSRRYHMKQFQHIGKLETESKVLEAEIALTSPRIRFTQRKNMLLQAENDSIKQKIATCSGKLMVQQAEHEKLQKEADSLKQLFQVMKMQEAEAAFNPLAGPGPAPLGCQVFGPNSEANYQPFNPLEGLSSETVDFGQFYETAAADQFNFEPPGLDDQFSSDPVGLNRQLDEPVGFSEFTDELAVVVRPHILANKGADQVGAGADQSIEGMNLDSSDGSQKAAGSSSDQFM
ncbi:basic leucine zipper 2-like [Rosa chinensis]|uniref:basic leucine zipper 2-like n=1 Tax=Rosa chinensis TaxID=74649 RepID=UPI001AD8DCCB|nr:basic leucine zipper 2-like [Rosa chinensis]